MLLFTFTFLSLIIYSYSHTHQGHLFDVDNSSEWRPSVELFPFLSLMISNCDPQNSITVL